MSGAPTSVINEFVVKIGAQRFQRVNDFGRLDVLQEGRGIQDGLDGLPGVGIEIKGFFDRGRGALGR
jgi:hypothetical protein